MKRRILFLLAVFAAFIPLFAVQKPLFMLYHLGLASDVAAIDWLRVIAHGLTLDMTVAGYLTCIPVLMVLLSVWWRGRGWKIAFRAYFLLVAFVAATIFAADMALYSFWGFRIDASVFFYLASPKDAMASVTWGMALAQVIVLLLYGAAFYLVFRQWIIPIFNDKIEGWGMRLGTSLLVLLFGALLILPIRGGLSASTANEGRVYFSPNLFLNHAAVNPAFSLFNSALHRQSFAATYHFFDEPKRAALFARTVPDSCGGAPRRLLQEDNPNIILIILEGITSNAVGALGGTPGVTPNLDSLAKEGILFTNLYASSFRTDRGLVAILNGYPGQPTTSIMKYPAKSQQLPSIAGSLAARGYETGMYYGGDIDFTNMRSYFYGSGYRKVVGQDGLRFSEPMSRWGYNDALMLDWFAGEVQRLPEPFFATLLTLSSHEPFDVPYHRLEDPYLNSVAFTDACIGDFIRTLKATPLWDRTWVIMLSDHGYRYPETVGVNDPLRQREPMLWLGGALAGPGKVDRMTSQTDLAATLLGQLGEKTEPFRFSRDMLCDNYPDFVFYTFNNGFGAIDSLGVTIWDANTGSVREHTGTGDSTRLELGKAFLQTLMEDFDAR